MRFLTYTYEGNEQVGVLSSDGRQVYALKDLGISCSCMQSLIEEWGPAMLSSIQQALTQHPEKGVALEHIQFEAVIPHPRHDILCLGLNYAEHVKEGAKVKGLDSTLPEYPVYFSKRVDRAIGHNGFIDSHSDITNKLDYEVELAVIIGKTCDHVKPEEVYEYIFGYTVANDVSARDLQTLHKQWFFGKSLNGFAALGPWIVTADELGKDHVFTVQSRVNGEIRQNSATDQFIFDIPRVISELSSGITLYPGDILITGTPSGVGLGFDPPKWLYPGDVVECEVGGVGILRNQVK